MNQDKRPAYAPRCFGLASAFGADEDICGQCQAAAECGPIAKDNLVKLSKLINVSHVGSMHFIAEPKKPEATSVPALPKPDPSAASIRRYGATTPKEMAEINAILAEVGDIPEPDDLPSATLSNNTAPGPKRPETATVPAMPEAKPVAEAESNGIQKYVESGDLDVFLDGFIVDSQPREALIECLQELFSKPALSVDEVALARKISIELSKLGVPPIERDLARCKLSGAVCEKDKSAALMMNHLQTFDIQWGHTRHPGQKTHEKASDGKFANIFTPDNFDWDHAMEIANLNLKPATKAKYLNLPASCLLGMLILRDEQIHERQRTIRRQEKKQALIDYERSLEIEKDAIDIKARLTRYKESNSKASLNIDVYINVWKAMELCKGSKNYLTDARIHYEKLTGESVTKSLMQKRVGILKNALKK